MADIYLYQIDTGSDIVLRDPAMSVIARVVADFAVAYAIEAPALVRVISDFPVSYAIAAQPQRVIADFAAQYQIFSEVVMSYTRSKARTIEVLPAGVPFAAPVAGFWNMSNPKKPVGPKDPNATIDISFDWNKFLADCTDTIGAHVFVLTNGLTNKGSSISEEGIITVFLAGGSGTSATVTCRVTTASTPPREEDRTITLSLEER